MDLELLKTFLEVHHTRHFGKAAEHLYITPSAVSARIRLLEEQLGVSLFTRNRNNIELTLSGERLLNHAKHLIRSWEKARYDVHRDSQNSEQLSILAVPSLWGGLLLPVVTQLHSAKPKLSIMIESLPSDAILHRLQQNQNAIGFSFEPHTSPSLEVVAFDELVLVMVSSEKMISSEQALDDGHIAVDWGAAFITRFDALYPDAKITSIRASTGQIAFDLLCSGVGTSCYLPESIIKTAIKEKRVFQVKDAPVIRIPVYAAYSIANRSDVIVKFLQMTKDAGS